MTGQPPSCQSPFQQKRLPYQYTILKRLSPGPQHNYSKACRAQFGAACQENVTFLSWKYFPGPLSVMEKLLLGELRYDWYSRTVVLLLWLKHVEC